MIKLINKDGSLFIEKGNGEEELCKLEELKTIYIESEEILVETVIADISFEIDRSKKKEENSYKEKGSCGGCGGCGSN